jgi:hypothetical protein
VSELAQITQRLGEIAAALRDPELSNADAETLAREAADLVAKAGNEIERASRGGESPGE